MVDDDLHASTTPQQLHKDTRYNTTMGYEHMGNEIIAELVWARNANQYIE